MTRSVLVNNRNFFLKFERNWRMSSDISSIESFTNLQQLWSVLKTDFH